MKLDVYGKNMAKIFNNLKTSTRWVLSIYQRFFPKEHATEPMPSFEGYTSKNVAASSGKQKKAPGSGFYVKDGTEEEYYIKRSTKFVQTKFI